MKSFCLLMSMALFFSFKIQAQNLVRNGSFEELGNLPVRPNINNSYEYEPNSGYKPFQKNLKYWYGATTTTPDLRITDKQQYENCKKRFPDCDKARTGHHSVGFITYMSNVKTGTYREYLQSKLKDIIKPNVKTYIEFWIRKERQASLVSNNVGLHFSYHPIKEKSHSPLDVLPQFNVDKIINKTTSNWIKIEGHFIPEQPYRYVSIGNFYTNEQTDVIKYDAYTGNTNVPPYAYYLIDDIRIWQEGDMPETPVFKDKKVTNNEPIPLRHITFETNSATLKNTSYEELDKLYDFLINYPEVHIALHGHTDNVGQEEDNFRLSTARARRVYDFLITKNIAAERLRYVGFGETKPTASNEVATGRQKNRRVEFLVVEDERK